MNRNRQKTNTPNRPPLSILDRCIYWLVLILIMVSSVIVLFCFEAIQKLIAFTDPTVIADVEQANFLFVLPLLFFIDCSAIIFFMGRYGNNTPIFGNAKVTYGQYPWDKNCYPMFDKRHKTVETAPSEKKRRRKKLLLWTIGFLLFLMIAPLSLFGRECLHNDLSISSYNIINQVSDKAYATQDYHRLTLRTEHVTGYRRASYWKYEMEIEMTDGKSFWFSNKAFDSPRPGDQDTCLMTMTQIKQLFPPDSITIVGADDVDKVADYLGMNEAQSQELHRLFAG